LLAGISNWLKPAKSQRKTPMTYALYCHFADFEQVFAYYPGNKSLLKVSKITLEQRLGKEIWHSSLNPNS